MPDDQIPNGYYNFYSSYSNSKSLGNNDNRVHPILEITMDEQVSEIETICSGCFCCRHM